MIDDLDQTDLSPLGQLAPGLYVVATPLGHARDITLRALDVLKSADLILCEDTRVTRKLAQIYGIKTPLRAYHDHNEGAASQAALVELSAGKAVALVSDAGTPVVSDPGFRLTRLASAEGHNIFPIPGAASPIAALSVSGLPSDRFQFLGFLPSKAQARQRALRGLVPEMGTIIIFESPNRLCALLQDLSQIFGDIEAVVAREMTKKFEEIQRGTPDALHTHFASKTIRGECVVLFSMPEAKAPTEEVVDLELSKALVTQSVRDAAALVAEKLSLPRKTVYARAIALSKSDEILKPKDE